MCTRKRLSLISCIMVSLAALMYVILSSCGSSSSSGTAQQAATTPQGAAARTVTAPLGTSMKNVPLTAGATTQVKFTYTIPPASPSSPAATDLKSYKGFTVNLANTMSHVTLSSVPLAAGPNLWDKVRTYAKLTEALAASTGQITAFVSYPGDSAVCSSQFRFGPYTMIGDVGVATTSQTSSASPTDPVVNITNYGSFEVCLVITSPISAFLTVSDVAIDLATCDQPDAAITGAWSGTFSCSNFGVGNDTNQPVALTITKNSDGTYSYTDDGGALYTGRACGNTFKFNGGKSGQYTESGTFLLNGDGTATKTSTWNSVPPGTSGGTCSDSLHR